MPKLTAQEAAAKHASRLKGATEHIRNGVNRVSVAPGQLAAAKQEKMVANWNAAIQSGKWARNVASVPLEEWKRKMVDVGIARIAAGIDAAQARQTDFYQKLFDHQATLQAEVSRMPDISLEDNLNRMTTFIRGMARFSYRRS